MARLLGELFAALGVLSTGNLEETAPADYFSAYRGESEEKTRQLIKRAKGGVLFIDEPTA